MIAWNLATNEARAEASINESGCGSWGIICTSPSLNDSVAYFLSQWINVPQTVYPFTERFKIEVEIASNKIADPPNTLAYDQCAINYTATVKVLQPVGSPYADHFIDKVVIAIRNWKPNWETTYDSWNGTPRYIDAVVGDYPEAIVRVYIKPNNGDGYGLLISGEWEKSKHSNSIPGGKPFDEFGVYYPHLFLPKKK